VIHPALVVIACNFLAIGALPILFFRRDGRLNAMWWMTGGPFFVCPLFLIAADLGWVAGAARYRDVFGPLQAHLAIVPSLASIALLFLTLGTHRIPIALWHQSNDAPKHIVTWGAYRHVRHPFYVSFLLAFAAAVLFLPHPVVVALALYVVVVLSLTAAREERRLAASELGEEYKEYIRHTGRFWPSLGGGRR
jgi:protein-S-isoprenylcysteine O-methyltransferase Ste14